MFLPFSQRARDWEPKALALRHLAGIGPNSLLDPWSLAGKAGLLVVDAAAGLLDALDSHHREQLLNSGGRKWSGGVHPLALPDGKRICILNPADSHRRNRITLMEEIVHIHFGHTPTRLVFDGRGLRARDFNPEQEGEAYGVGAAALLPWHLFFPSVNKGLAPAELADNFKVSQELIEYRVKICGAHNLFQARRRVLSSGHR